VCQQFEKYRTLIYFFYCSALRRLMSNACQNMLIKIESIESIKWIMNDRDWVLDESLKDVTRDWTQMVNVYARKD
jgi:hypothetical protein